jgi:hypothetical protein
LLVAREARPLVVLLLVRLPVVVFGMPGWLAGFDELDALDALLADGTLGPWRRGPSCAA